MWRTAALAETNPRSKKTLPLDFVVFFSMTEQSNNQQQHLSLIWFAHETLFIERGPLLVLK